MNKETILFSSEELTFNLMQMEFAENSVLRDFHFHDAIEIVRVDQGEICCFIEKEQIILGVEDLLLINKYTVHKLCYYHNSALVTYLQIDMSRYSDLNQLYMYLPLLHTRFIPYKKFDTNGDMNALLNDIIHEQANKGFCYGRYIKADIYRIYAIMSRNLLIPDTDSTSDISGLDRITPVLEYVEENFNNKIHLEDICSVINMDKYYFCKLFKKTTGVTFVSYVNFVRLKKAEDSLLHSTQTITEIAYANGFSSTQYFNRAFLTHKGCTPMQFRRLHVPAVHAKKNLPLV